uniref:EGF-like domain-containing protein n=1 Tax=Panagrolaimus davidi TaxID=227884 RepID=A0A914PR67_9BILA
MQHCVEESCSGHGIVKLGTKNFKCECHCEENYSGEKCETISPCRNLECTNNGKCVISPETGEAKCECPKSSEIYLIEAEIKGEFCEIIHIDDSKITPEKCLPCTGDFQKWIQCIEKHDHIMTFNKQRVGLGFLWSFDDESFKKLNGTYCFHEGKCNVVVDKFPHDFYLPKLRNQLFLVPKCDCKESYQGDFCEHIHNTTDGACDPKGVIKDTSKCNPCEEAKDSFKCLNGGTCLFNEIDGLHCYCPYGFKGTMCEIKNPCEEDPKPCEDNDSICVEISDGTNSPRHACICGFNQDVTSSKCITPDHEICKTAAGKPTCKNKGHCYPCALDENEKISLCTEDETKRGFRCICPPGFLPPFCDHEVTACSYHKCQNGAKCIPKNGTLADYDCECKHDYNGTFCEQSPGICKAEGFLVCAHGSCVENSKSERGFDCNCNEGFYGDNCHLEEEFNFFNEIDVSYYCRISL